MRYLATIFILLIAESSKADIHQATSSDDGASLSSLIQFGLENSLDQSGAQAESHFQETNQKVISKTQFIPRIDLSASYQKFSYDNLYTTTASNGATQSISNNGQNPSVALTISYDLQKLFGPESELAKRSTYYAKAQEKITARNTIRNLKKCYFTILETQSEIAELNTLIGRFEQIDRVLQKQRKIGVYNELERRQFRVQQSILNSDLEAKKSDLDATFHQLSTLINLDIASTQERVHRITQKAELHFAHSTNLELQRIAKMKDQEMLENISQDYNLSKLEYEKFSSLPLPTFYIRGSRSVSTVPSSDGPQSMAEVGLSFPIDGFTIRSAQKSMLGAKSERSQILLEKSLSQYRSQIELTVNNLSRLKSQTESLKQTHHETEKLLDKSFLFYSQKRIDVLGTLDIFQKYLQAARNSHLNEFQIQMMDTELEYLVGGI